MFLFGCEVPACAVNCITSGTVAAIKYYVRDSMDGFCIVVDESVNEVITKPDFRYDAVGCFRIPVKDIEMLGRATEKLCHAVVLLIDTKSGACCMVEYTRDVKNKYDFGKVCTSMGRLAKVPSLLSHLQSEKPAIEDRNYKPFSSLSEGFYSCYLTAADLLKFNNIFCELRDYHIVTHNCHIFYRSLVFTAVVNNIMVKSGSNPYGEAKMFYNYKRKQGILGDYSQCLSDSCLWVEITPTITKRHDIITSDAPLLERDLKVVVSGRSIDLAVIGKLCIPFVGDLYKHVIPQNMTVWETIIDELSICQKKRKFDKAKQANDLVGCEEAFCALQMLKCDDEHMHALVEFMVTLKDALQALGDAFQDSRIRNEKVCRACLSTLNALQWKNDLTSKASRALTVLDYSNELDRLSGVGNFSDCEPIFRKLSKFLTQDEMTEWRKYYRARSISFAMVRNCSFEAKSMPDSPVKLRSKRQSVIDPKSLIDKENLMTNNIFRGTYFTSRDK